MSFDSVSGSDVVSLLAVLFTSYDSPTVSELSYVTVSALDLPRGSDVISYFHSLRIDSASSKDVVNPLLRFLQDVVTASDAMKLILYAVDGYIPPYPIAIDVAVYRYLAGVEEPATASEVRLSPVPVASIDLASAVQEIVARLEKMLQDYVYGLDLSMFMWFAIDSVYGSDYSLYSFLPSKDLSTAIEIVLSPYRLVPSDVASALEAVSFPYRELMFVDRGLAGELKSYVYSILADLSVGSELATQSIYSYVYGYGVEVPSYRYIESGLASSGFEVRLSPIPLSAYDYAVFSEYLVSFKDMIYQDISSSLDYATIYFFYEIVGNIGANIAVGVYDYGATGLDALVYPVSMQIESDVYAGRGMELNVYDYLALYEYVFSGMSRFVIDLVQSLVSLPSPSATPQRHRFISDYIYSIGLLARHATSMLFFANDIKYGLDSNSYVNSFSALIGLPLSESFMHGYASGLIDAEMRYLQFLYSVSRLVDAEAILGFGGISIGIGMSSSYSFTFIDNVFADVFRVHNMMLYGFAQAIGDRLAFADYHRYFVVSSYGFDEAGVSIYTDIYNRLMQMHLHNVFGDAAPHVNIANEIPEPLITASAGEAMLYTSVSDVIMYTSELYGLDRVFDMLVGKISILSDWSADIVEMVIESAEVYEETALTYLLSIIGRMVSATSLNAYLNYTTSSYAKDLSIYMVGLQDSVYYSSGLGIAENRVVDTYTYEYVGGMGFVAVPGLRIIDKELTEHIIERILVSIIDNALKLASLVSYIWMYGSTGSAKYSVILTYLTDTVVYAKTLVKTSEAIFATSLRGMLYHFYDVYRFIYSFWWADPALPYIVSMYLRYAYTDEEITMYHINQFLKFVYFFAEWLRFLVVVVPISDPDTLSVINDFISTVNNLPEFPYDSCVECVQLDVVRTIADKMNKVIDALLEFASKD